MCFHLSNEFYCRKSATKRHENMMQTRVNFTQNWLRDEQIVIGTRENKTLMVKKNNPKISGSSITNLHLTPAWAEENFPVLRDLLGPIELETSIFFRNRRQCFIIQVLTLTQVLSTNQHGVEWSLTQNVATNLHSVKYETLRFVHGPLVFLLYNFINKVHSNIDTELCTCLNFFDL